MVRKSCKYPGNSGNTQRYNVDYKLLNRSSYIEKRTGTSKASSSKCDSQNSRPIIEKDFQSNGLLSDDSVRYSLDKQKRWSVLNFLSPKWNCTPDEDWSVDGDTYVIQRSNAFYGSKGCHKFVDINKKDSIKSNKAKSWRRNIPKLSEKTSTGTLYTVYTPPDGSQWEYHMQDRWNYYSKGYQYVRPRWRRNKLNRKRANKKCWSQYVDEDDFYDYSISDNEYDEDCTYSVNSVRSTSVCLGDYTQVKPQTRKNHSSKKKLSYAPANAEDTQAVDENNFIRKGVLPALVSDGRHIVEDYVTFDTGVPSDTISIETEQTDFTVVPDVENGYVYVQSPITEIQSQEISFDAQSIRKDMLMKNFSTNYFEGESIPRCFAIMINASLNNEKCFVAVIVTCLDGNAFGSNVCAVKFISTVKCMKKYFETFINTSSHEGIKTFIDFIELLQTYLVSSTDGDLVINPSSRMIFKDQTKKVPVNKLQSWRSFALRNNIDVLFHHLCFIAELNMLNMNLQDCTTKNALQEDNEDIIADDYCLVCPICLLDIKPSSSRFQYSNGLCLKSCKHWICDDCWSMYIYTQINIGRYTTMECPVKDCLVNVDFITALNYICNEQIQIFLSGTVNSIIAQHNEYRPCPTIGCDAVLVYKGFDNSKIFNTKGTSVVSCICGDAYCFACGYKVHWPASCKAGTKFTSLIKKLSATAYHDNFLTVEVKPCPFCHTFINKNAGCNYMQCHCGKSFCWNCLQSYDDHPSPCYKKPVKEYQFSTLDVIDSKLGREVLQKSMFIKKKISSLKKLPISKSFQAFIKSVVCSNLLNECHSRVVQWMSVLVDLQNGYELLHSLEICRLDVTNGTAHFYISHLKSWLTIVLQQLEYYTFKAINDHSMAYFDQVLRYQRFLTKIHADISVMKI